MAGPVLGLTKQYIGLEVLSNYTAAYASNLLVYCLELISHALSHTISLSLFNRGIRSFKVLVLLIVGFCLQ